MALVVRKSSVVSQVEECCVESEHQNTPATFGRVVGDTMAPGLDDYEDLDPNGMAQPSQSQQTQESAFPQQTQQSSFQLLPHPSKKAFSSTNLRSNIFGNTSRRERDNTWDGGAINFGKDTQTTIGASNAFGAEPIASNDYNRNLAAPTPSRRVNLPQLEQLPHAPLSPNKYAHPSVELDREQQTPRNQAYQRAAKATPLPGDFPHVDDSEDEEEEDLAARAEAEAPVGQPTKRALFKQVSQLKYPRRNHFTGKLITHSAAKIPYGPFTRMNQLSIKSKAKPLAKVEEPQLKEPYSFITLFNTRSEDLATFEEADFAFKTKTEFREFNKNRGDLFFTGVVALFDEKDRLQKQNDALSEQRGYALEEIEALNNKAQTLMDDNVSLRDRIDEVEAAGMDRANHATELTQQVNELNQKLQNTTQELHAANSDKLDARRQLSATQNRLQMASESREGLHARLEAMTTKITQLEGQLPQQRQQSVHFGRNTPVADPTRILNRGQRDSFDGRIRPTTTELNGIYNEKAPDVPHHSRPPSSNHGRRGLNGGDRPEGGQGGGGGGGGFPPSRPPDSQFGGSSNRFPGGAGPPGQPAPTGPPGPPDGGPPVPGSRSHFTSGGTPRRITKDPLKKFFGNEEDRKNFEAWCFEVNHILLEDTDYWNNNIASAVNWVGTRTDGEAFGYIKDYLPASGKVNNIFKTPEAVLRYLKTIYGEYDEEAKVIEDYRQLKMKSSENFDSFLAKFNSKALRLGHSDKQMKYDLHHKLNDKYRDRIGNMLLRNYSDLVDACRELRNVFAVEKIHEKAHGTDFSSSKSNRYKSYKSRSSYSTPESKNGGISMSALPEEFRNLPRLTSSLRSQLSKENKCWNCHKVGHRANDNDCPLSRYRDVLKQIRDQQRPMRLNMATLDDDRDYSDQLSDLPSDDDEEGESNLMDLNDDSSSSGHESVN